MGIQDIFGQMAETLSGAVNGVQDIIADPQSAIGEIAGQAISDGGISDIIGGIGDGIAENVPGVDALDSASVVESLGNAPESLEGMAGDLSGILDGSPLGDAADSLGGVLEDPSLGDIMDGLGGLFSRG